MTGRGPTQAGLWALLGQIGAGATTLQQFYARVARRAEEAEGAGGAGWQVTDHGLWGAEVGADL